MVFSRIEFQIIPFGTIIVILSNMNKLAFLVFFLSVSAFGQKPIAFVDFNNFFRSFQSGQFRQLEFQLIEEFKAGDDLVAYIDNRGNLRVYDGVKTKDIANLKVEYTVSDHLLTWKIGNTLNLWDDGDMRTLSFNAAQYAVRDSMVVFMDMRYNNINVYEKGESKPIAMSTGDLNMPLSMGENCLAFKDNGDFYKLYWNGKVIDLDVWVGSIVFSSGTDVIAFNDPTTRTFAVFDKGIITDVEQFFVKTYQAGRGFVVYEDLNGNLIKYENGLKTPLTRFSASFYEVKDDVVIWVENGFLYMESNGKKWQVCNYTPLRYKVKNDVLVFENAMRGISIAKDGKLQDITNQMDAEFEIYGSSVLVRLFNNSYIVFANDRKYEP
jgi:hypothetical protein